MYLYIYIHICEPVHIYLYINIYIYVCQLERAKNVTVGNPLCERGLLNIRDGRGVKESPFCDHLGQVIPKRGTKIHSIAKLQPNSSILETQHPSLTERGFPAIYLCMCKWETGSKSSGGRAVA